MFEPLWATLGATWPNGGYAWFGTHTGVFVISLITIAVAGILVSIGMGFYHAKIQRWCFVGGMIGFAVVVLLLLVEPRTPASSARSTSRPTRSSA